MKKFFLVFVMILACFSFSACGTKPVAVSDDVIMLSLNVGRNGQVRQSLNFSFDTERLNKLGFTEQQIQATKEKLIFSVDKLREEFILNFTIIYGQNPIEDYAINKGLIFSQTSLMEGLIGFSMDFINQEVWKFYHSSEKEEPSASEIAFISKSISRGQFPFSASLDSLNVTVGERYKNLYLQAIKEVLIQEEYANFLTKFQINYIYDYSTPNNRIKSNANAQAIDEKGCYHHIWVRNDDNYIIDQVIELHVNIVNRGWWYLALLGVTIVVIGGGFGWIYFKKK